MIIIPTVFIQLCTCLDIFICLTNDISRPEVQDVVDSHWYLIGSLHTCMQYLTLIICILFIIYQTNKFNILSTVICFQMHTTDYSQTDDKIFPSLKLNLIAG